MEKKDREAINIELSELNDALEELVEAKKEVGEARKRMNEYSKQFKLPEIGCSNKETDDEFENKLKKLKSEHYRTQDCIKSALDAHGITLGETDQISEGKGEHLVASCSDDSGENKEEKTQELKKKDDVKKNDSTDSDDVEGLNGGTGKSDDELED